MYVNRGRGYTVSIAVGASVIENTQSAELATAAAGQIARAAAIFNVDEIVVIDDAVDLPREPGAVGAAAAFLARVLQYLETPQYLRRELIPMHQDFKFAGQLPPLVTPNHLLEHEWLPYREGVVLSEGPSGGSLIDVGLKLSAYVPATIAPRTRVTLSVGAERRTQRLDGVAEEVIVATVVSPSEPRTVGGLYWGYSTRLAPSLSSALLDCPFQGGYDFTIGTSERGDAVSAYELQVPSFKHLLIAFGGPHGLEQCVQADGSQQDPRGLFQKYLNTCLNQGSKTIRTEEAILISLSYLAPAIAKAVQE